MNAPKIDPRTYQQLVEQAEALAGQYTAEAEPTAAALAGRTLRADIPDGQGGVIARAGTAIDEALAQTLAGVLPEDKLVPVEGWRAGSAQTTDAVTDAAADAGQALIRIFARYAELVVDRINRAPDKNYLAFLNLVGVDAAPPAPARVPLTFTLAANSPVDALVPSGTQVAAPPLGPDEDEVIFATDRDLVVTRAELASVFVNDTAADAYAEHSAQALGQTLEKTGGEDDQPFAIFLADQPAPHELYLACDDVLTQPGPKQVTVAIQAPAGQQWTNWPITWAYWDGGKWQEAASSTFQDDDLVFVTLQDVPAITPSSVAGVTAAWLRGRLAMRLPADIAGSLPDAIVTSPMADPQPIVGPFNPFGERDGRVFYLCADEAFGRAGARLSIDIELATGGVREGDLVLSWAYQAGADWVELGQSAGGTIFLDDFNPGQIDDGTLALTQSGTVSFWVPEGWPRELLRTRQGRWLRVQIQNSRYTEPPVINALTISCRTELPGMMRIFMQAASPSALAPELGPPLAFANYSLLELDRDFYPLGEQPRFNDTFYIACPPEIARPGGALRLRIEITNPPGSANGVVPPVYTGGGPEIAWESWNGARWERVVDGDPTQALSTNADMTVVLPSGSAPVGVNGEEQVWVRGRLLRGDYGRAGAFDLAQPLRDDRGAFLGYKYVPPTLAPPLIKAISWAPVAGGSAPLSGCISHNNYTYANWLGTLAAGGTFQPFTPAAAIERALYLGFGEPFGARPVSLYLQVEAPRPEEVAVEQMQAGGAGAQAQVAWEYSGAGGWQPLAASDETAAFSSRGIVSFIGPPDSTARTYFGREQHWLRARWAGGQFAVAPRLRRVRLNTTWATQAVRVEEEILGAGNGEAMQRLRTAQAPVQPAQQLLVREPDLPPAAERAAIVAEEGPAAISVTQDAAGQPDEIWVRWHAVADFYQSGPRDRHYTIDALAGEIQFGDGRQGMLPPQGQNNIRIRYRSGGGEQGNRPAGTLVELKSSVPGVEGVTNHEPSGGGAARSSLSELQARGPRFLRHRNSAIAAQDLADLAQAAAPEVARVAVVTPAFDPKTLWIRNPRAAGADFTEHQEVGAGQMGVLVVPNGTEARPTPSLGLLRRVERHLAARAPATAGVWVAGPEWIEVVVTTTVAPASIEKADGVAARVQAALDGFLHPLTGGRSGEGWAFGRNPHDSDLFAVLEGVAGVDHVQTLAVARTPVTADADRQVRLQALLERPLGAPDADADSARRGADRRWIERALVYSGRHAITVSPVRQQR